MRKIFWSVLICAMMIFSEGFATVNPHENDPNYIRVWRDMYLDLRTVAVQQNSSPYYLISGVIGNRGVTLIFDEIAQLTLYRDKSGNWKVANVFGTDSSSTSSRKFADALFKAAFGREFYGNNFTRKATGIDPGVPDMATNRIALGGIELGATPERIRSIYGTPDGIKKLAGRDLSFWGGNSGEFWLYGDLFGITFIDGHALLITSSAKNGIKTPDGISVGDSAEKLYRTYGRAAKCGANKDGKLYSYKNGHRILSFTVRDDKIISIGIFVE